MKFQPPALEEIIRLFPELEIIGLLGAGGMGAVYKGRQPALDRFVALKVMPGNGSQGGNFEERFNREARALARLNHPNIVAVYEFGQVGHAPNEAGLHFFLMEFVDGANLRQLEQAGRLAPREALQIIPQICDALQYAHDEGVVHRDIKPENVLVDRKGRVKIADFGLAKILGVETETSRLTAEGQVMGTPHYMAPEQIEKPLTVDHRADIYSLGVVLYEMLTGDLPLGKFAPPSRKYQLDVRLDEVVLRALENDPARRYQHASEVKSQVEDIAGTAAAAKLGELARKEPGRAGNLRAKKFSRKALFGASLVIVCGVILGWVWERPSPSEGLRNSLELDEKNIAAGNRSSKAPVERLAPDGGPFVARFDAGTVELVALRRYPDEGSPWWSPDGRPSSIPSGVQANVLPDSGPGPAGVEFLLELKGTNVSFLDPNLYSAKGDARYSVSRRLPPPSDATETSFTLWLAGGPWQTAATQKTGLLGGFASDGGRRHWSWSSNPDGSILLEVGKWPLPAPYTAQQFVAVDAKGMEHLPWKSQQNWLTSESVMNVTMMFGGAAAAAEIDRGLTLDQVKEFRFQIRHGSPVVFKQVSLQPGNRTRVAVASSVP